MYKKYNFCGGLLIFFCKYRNRQIRVNHKELIKASYLIVEL